MTKRSRFFQPLWALSVLAMPLVITGCAKQEAPPAPPAMPVSTKTLSSENVADYSEYVATLISRNSVSLQSQVSGQITAIYVQPGQRVRKGQPLITIDPAQQQAALMSANAVAASQQSGIQQAKDNLRVVQEQRAGLQSVVTTSKAQFERYNTLLEQKSASVQEVDRYRNEYEQAQANLLANTAQLKAQQAGVRSAQRQYQQAQAGIHQQQAQLRYYKMVAPFAGNVGDIPVKLGNYVEGKTDLLSVTDNSKLEINISVPIEHLSSLRVGLPVQVVSESGQLLGSAKVFFVSPRIDTQAQTVLVKAIAENSKGILKADQVANVRIIWKDKPGLRIPTEAVVHMGGRDFVYVMKTAEAAPAAGAQTGHEEAAKPAAPAPADDGKPHYVARQIPINVGRVEGNDYIVESGLKAGDDLIVSGIQKLGDGAPVQKLPDMPPAGQMPSKEPNAGSGH